MKIEQHLKAEIMRPFGNFYCFGFIVIPPAKRLSVYIEGMIPDAQPNPVNAMIFQNLQGFLLHP